jgi:ATP-dependent Lhr-like helicase
MTEADKIFSRFPPFIKEYVYSHGWDSFREVQLDAARVIFDTDDNLLLSSSTASGKTEAAFFPILTELYESQSRSGGVSVIYIAPLKSLINDQFVRMQDVLLDCGVELCHWHGDVSASHKEKLLRQPSGILQITPESLESMLINRSNDIPRIFADLRYIVIDEIHTMIGTDRGNQILCLISRLTRRTGIEPRRIGLSATIGDIDMACRWLSSGSSRRTSAPIPSKTQIKWRLGMEHFYMQNTSADGKAGAESETGHAKIDAGYEFLYDCVKDKKAIVFSNSREETEYVTATLRQISKNRGDRDKFLIHHGNLSASLREDAENRMKNDDEDVVTCATVTMELGIDIGKLDRVAQVGAPYRVSSFLQRLGRSGRRGSPPEMIMVYREESPLPNTPLPQLIPWELLRGIAVVELYREDRFIEPPIKRKMPLSLLFHQTLSTLASSGGLSAGELSLRVLSLPPFDEIKKEDYRELLVSMVNSDYIEMMEDGTLIIGLAGERIIGSFKFYAVFKDSEDFTVRCDSDEIGTITSCPPVGERFALAGRVWEVTDTDVSHRLIFVRAVEGKMQIAWPGDSGEVHTRVLKKMREILLSDKEYPYLMPNAQKRLNVARHTAKATKMDTSLLVGIGGSSKCLFPWLGTRAHRTLRRYLAYNAHRFGISDIQSEGCCYITFKSQRDEEDILRDIQLSIENGELDASLLVGEAEHPSYDKYDPYIPAALLRRAYVSDKLAPDELLEYFY